MDGEGKEAIQVDIFFDTIYYNYYYWLLVGCCVLADLYQLHYPLSLLR